MRSSYKKLGDYIRQVDEKNSDLSVKTLLGVSISKDFIPSVANTHGVDLSKYKVVRKNQFACKLMSVGRDEQLPVDILKNHDEAIVSSAYYVFEPVDPNLLHPDYLKMWLSRSETDRWVGYVSGGDVRGGISWDLFCEMPIRVPTTEKQREIVREYHTIVDRIKLNEQLNQKLEETAQAIYKQWFVDFEFPMSKEHAAKIGKPELEGKPYKSSGGKMVWNDELDQEIPEGWIITQLSDICSKIGSGATPKGGKASYRKSGISLIRSLNVHDYNFLFKDLAFIGATQASKLANVEIEQNDVLLNITGVSVARCCRVPENVLPARVNQHVSIVRLEPKMNSTAYLLCNLCSENSKAQLLGTSHAGSTRQAITKADIESFRILWPDSFARIFFDDLAGSLFTFKESISLQTEKLIDLQRLLLMRLAVGSQTEAIA